jgi:hypothetical protein
MEYVGFYRMFCEQDKQHSYHYQTHHLQFFMHLFPNPIEYIEVVHQ